MDALKGMLLAKLKKLKGIDDNSSDDVFSFAIETALYDVLNYCNLTEDDFPVGLHNTVVLMSIDLLNETNFSLNATKEGEVKALTEGDFSISRETKAEAYQKMASVPSFTKNYKRNLNSFRKLR